MQDSIENLQKELQLIHERNSRVEAEKAWERSRVRILSIVGVTYILAGFVFLAIGNDHPWRNALIPTIGYFLSTQSFPFLKRKWISNYLHKKRK